eukprot:COSAG01_NODE_6420_length_3677_cov_4.065120_2_plen_71_part_00
MPSSSRAAGAPCNRSAWTLPPAIGLEGGRTPHGVPASLAGCAMARMMREERPASTDNNAPPQLTTTPRLN